jgi:hypothetical protein
VLALSPRALKRSAKYTPLDARRQVANAIVAARNVGGEQITSLPHDLSAYLTDSENAIDTGKEIVSVPDQEEAFSIPRLTTLGEVEDAKENPAYINSTSNPLDRPVSSMSMLESDFKRRNNV